MRQFLCKSKNGVSVLYDPVGSHAATHLEDTPQLKELVVEIVEGLNLEGEEIGRHFDIGRVVGASDVVRVDDADEIVYAMRKNRRDEGLVPFTKSRDGEPDTHVTIQLVPQPDGTYELATAWIGTYDPDEDQPFPQSPDATDQSIDYWNKYAFVWGSQEIIPGTLTTQRPW